MFAFILGVGSVSFYMLYKFYDSCMEKYNVYYEEEEEEVDQREEEKQYDGDKEGEGESESDFSDIHDQLTNIGVERELKEKVKTLNREFTFKYNKEFYKNKFNKVLDEMMNSYESESSYSSASEWNCVI